MTAFDKWLRGLAAAGKGPATLYCTRGVAFRSGLALQADLTGATIRGEVRASPDATGAPLAVFGVTALSVAAGITTTTLSLTEAEVGALPPDPTGDGVFDLVFDLLITPSGGAEDRLFAGLFQITGKVT